MRLARLDGQFYELYVADDDHSYTDAAISGQTLYRRDLRDGDSTAVFDDTTMTGIAGWYARQNPADRPLGRRRGPPRGPARQRQLGARPPRPVRPLPLGAVHRRPRGRRRRRLAPRPPLGDRPPRRPPGHRRRHHRRQERRLRAPPRRQALQPGARLGARLARRPRPRRRERHRRLQVRRDELRTHGSGRRPRHPLRRPRHRPARRGTHPPAAADPRRRPHLVARLARRIPARRRPTRTSRAGGTAPIEVRVAYSADGESGSATLLDSARRSWPIAHLPAPARRIFWLDGGAVDSVTRAALTRAFDEAALYSEDTRTAMTPPPKNARPSTPGEGFAARDLRTHDAAARQQPRPRLRRRHPLDDGPHRRRRRDPPRAHKLRHRERGPRRLPRADPPRRPRRS